MQHAAEHSAAEQQFGAIEARSQLQDGPGDRQFVGQRVDHRAVQQVLDQQYGAGRSEEHTSELQSLMRISYAVFCLKKKNTQQEHMTAALYEQIKCKPNQTRKEQRPE